jgi:hypothetical protein
MLEVNGAVAPWASGGTMTLTQNALLSCNCAGAYNFIGVQNGGGYYLDGYLAEVNTVDGLAQPASAFGLSDPVTGVWSPKKYIGTYGTNGYRLDFSDNSTVPNLLLDRSGNANNFGQSGVSVTPGTSNDSLFDSPTNYTDAGGVAHGKYATWSQLLLSYTVTNHGNLYTYNADTNPDQSLLVATIGVSSGKWVWEHTIITNGSAGSSPRIGAVRVIPASGVSLNPGSGTCLGFGYLYNGLVQVEGVNFATVSAMVANDAIRFELDLDAHTCAIFRNNTLQITLTGLIAGTYTPGVSEYGNSQTWTNFGQRPFANTPNAGFKTLCTQNLASAPTPALPASFIGNASASGPFIWAGGVVNSVTINGNVATRGAHFDGLSNGIRLKTASASFNASGTNTITAATYGASVKYSRAQGNP